MKKLFTSFFLLATFVASANNFHPAQRSDKTVVMDGNISNVHGHDSIFFDASQGQLGRWTFNNIHGSIGDTVVFINYGGDVYFTANITGDNGLHFFNCTFFKVVSAGGIHTKQIHIAGTLAGYMHGVACQIDGRSSDFDISGIDARDKASLFWIKQEPDCADSLCFPNWMIANFHVHHCKGRNLRLEGCYVMSTGSVDSGRVTTCNGIDYHYWQKQPLRGGNCEFDSLDIDSTGRGNLQVTLLEKVHNKIHDNILKHAGFEFNNAQGNNISVGNGSRDVEIYNNTTDGAYTNPLQINANGLVNIHDNNFGSAGNLYGHIPVSNGVQQHYAGALVRCFNYPYKMPGLGGSYLFRFVFKNNTWGTNTSGHDIEIQDNGSHQYDSANYICNSGIYVLGFGAHPDIRTSCPIDDTIPQDPVIEVTMVTDFKTNQTVINYSDGSQVFVKPDIEVKKKVKIFKVKIPE